MTTLVPSTGTLAVLLVEDNAGDSRLIREMLKDTHAAWTITEARRLADALSRLGEGGIDAVLLDLNLPDADGLVALSSISSRFPELPIVVLTGMDDELTALNAIHGRAQDYLVKGRIDGERLSKAVRYAVERKALEEQLRQAQKMEAIGRLAGGIAHDFNNLLGVILGCAELVQRSPALVDAERDRVRQMQSAAERAAALTRQLLTFSRKQVVVPELLRVAAVVDDLGRLLRRILGEDIELHIETARDARVRADRGQLEQVIMNLVLNARDAMPSGGTVTVSVTVEDRPPDTATPGSTSRWVVILVRDLGGGISPEVQKRIFEPYFTTKRPGEGTGLGLATVLGIVQEAGGHVEVESELGQGTTLRVFLPAVVGDPSGGAAPAEPAPPPAGRATQTILLVEDEDMLRSLMREILETEGYKVLEACDGSQALQVFEGHSEAIDLLVTDVVMPGIGGVDLCRTIRGIRGDMPVLLISGYNEELLASRGVPQERVEFLYKPFPVDRLVEKIGAALRSR
jgi:signal transduction histidine kinase